MVARISVPEQKTRIAALDDRSSAVFRQLQHSPNWLGIHQIAAKLSAQPAQVEPLLKSMIQSGLIEKTDASSKRPFGALYRVAPTRFEVVGDWLKGGDADRGYEDLAAIQRDYPSVRALSDPADGAEADKLAADNAAKQKAAIEANGREIKAQDDERKRRREENQLNKQQALEGSEAVND